MVNDVLNAQIRNEARAAMDALQQEAAAGAAPSSWHSRSHSPDPEVSERAEGVRVECVRVDVERVECRG